jgi:hypothetical protein
MIAGCAASGQLFKELEPPPAGKSAIYIYRVQDDVKRNQFLAPQIVIGKQTGGLLLDGYLRVLVEPGQTYISMQNNGALWPKGAPLKDLQVQAKAGEMHFVAFEMLSSRLEVEARTRTLYLGVSLQETTRQRAMFYLPRLKLLTVDGV